MPPKKGKKGKKTAAERERAKEMWRRYFEGYDLMMMSYPERLRSFTDWPFTEAEGATCTAERMAAAGFYLAPTDDEPDLARCFFCRRELDGWEPEDDPLSEHRRRDCPFVTLGKQQGEMEQAETVTLMVDRAKALLGKLTEDFQHDFDANKVETRSKVEDISGWGKETANGNKRRRTTKRK